MSTPRDPAVEAARRYWAAVEPDSPLQDDPEEWGMGGAIAAGAAREMVAPIRELHQTTDDCEDPYDRECDECRLPWPCDTAKLVYTSEELGE